MSEDARKAIIGSIGILSVLVATYVTKNANCLWALILVAIILDMD